MTGAVITIEQAKALDEQYGSELAAIQRRLAANLVGSQPKPVSVPHCTLEASEIKDAARGRWSEIITALCGIDPEYLTGRHGPCPVCGGTDRFRAFDDFCETGGMFCNVCHATDNGDGISTLMWLRGWDFPTALCELAAFLQVGDRHVQQHQRGPDETKSKKRPKTYRTAKDAIAALEMSHGPHSDLWAYFDAHGRPVGCICRWDLPGGRKKIRPVSRNDAGWFVGGMPEPRPLYRLTDLLGANRVYVAEGEKAADALRMIGLTATTSPHGSKSAGKADWTPLAGKDLVILPDNDEAGRGYADAVATILLGLCPPASVRVVDLPDLPEAGDAADWIPDRYEEAGPEAIRVEIERMVDAAELIRGTAFDARSKAKGEASIPEPSNRRSVDAFRIEAITAAELDAKTFLREDLVDGILVAGEPCIVSGSEKTLKTCTLIDMAVSLSVGGWFLGRFRVPQSRRVGIITCESGMPTIQETARRIAAAAGYGLAEIANLVFSESRPRLDDPRSLFALREFVLDHEFNVLMLDPIYLMMPGADAGNIFIQGERLGILGDLGRETGVTVVLCHHNKRGRQGNDKHAPPELGDISWAGFSAFARQWVLMGRRQDYSDGSGFHELWMRIGGSAGNTGLWAVDVDEGLRTDPGGRKWIVSVCLGAEAVQKAKDGQRRAKVEAAREEDREGASRLIDVLKNHLEGISLNKLANDAHMGDERAKRLLAELEREHVVECDATTSIKRWKLTAQWWSDQ